MTLKTNELIEKVQVGKAVEVLSNYSLQGKILLITSRSFSKSNVVASYQALMAHCDVILFDKVSPNPDVSQIKDLVEKFSHHEFDTIIALGGGSVLDTAKVLSLWLRMKQLDFERLLDANTSDIHKIPVVAIPTTAGTGAEVTPFATVWDSEQQKKFSISNVKPAHAILDAELTQTLPRQETLYSALDALSHSLESLWNTNCTEESKQYAGASIGLICDALPVVLEKPTDLESRRKLQIAATQAGLAISTTKTAIAHAISYPFTLLYNVPHGLACSFTLSEIIRRFGAQKLKLQNINVDKLLNVLERLSLADEMAQYVDTASVKFVAQLELAPSRAANFVCTYETHQIEKIITESAKPVE